jgi:hypothetical protein
MTFTNLFEQILFFVVIHIPHKIQSCVWLIGLPKAMIKICFWKYMRATECKSVSCSTLSVYGITLLNSN